MLDSLIKSIEDTFVQFSLRRLFYILFLIIIVFGSLYLFDHSTGYTFFNRIEKRIGALERLESLNEKGIKRSPELVPIYDSLVNELNTKNDQLPSLQINTEPFIKFTSAAIIFFILSIFGLARMLRGDPSGTPLFGGGMVLSIIFGLPALIIPTFSNIWWNAGAYFVIQVIFVALITKQGMKKK